jgi:hypothetical protein
MISKSLNKEAIYFHFNASYNKNVKKIFFKSFRKALSFWSTALQGFLGLPVQSSPT